MPDIQNVTFKDSNAGLPPETGIIGPPVKENPLDSDSVQAMFRTMRACFEYEKELQSSNRLEMAKDEAYYNHHQWTADDAEALRQRGQKATTRNLIKPRIDNLIGTESKTRLDFSVAPREEDDVEVAAIKKRYIKYLFDVNKGQYQCSAAFAEMCKAGLSWLETGIRADEEDEPLFIRKAGWRDSWYDSRAQEVDYSDARYFFRRRRVDLDTAIMLFPDRADELKAASDEALLYHDTGLDDEFTTVDVPAAVDEFGRVALNHGTLARVNASSNGNERNGRPMVDLIECWYKVPAPQGTKVLRQPFGSKLPPGAGNVHNEFFNPQNDLHKWAVQNQYASMYDTTKMQVRCMVWEHKNGTLLQDMLSPYRHNRIPFIWVFAYRDGMDGSFYGPVRGLRDAQEDMNKRYSKFLWLICNNQTIAERDAIDDPNEFNLQKSQPNGTMVVANGALSGGKIQPIVKNLDEAQAHVQMINLDMQYISQGAGVQDENLGIATNATSKVAMQERKDTGSITNYQLFDNYIMSRQILGEMVLSLSEQFTTEQKLVRIVGDRGKIEFEKINFPMPDGTILNDITNQQHDFIIQAVDFRDSIRQSLVESMLDLLSKMGPDIALQLMDVVVDMTDIENKEEIVQRIRKVNGQKDPEDDLQTDEQGNPLPTAQDQAAQAQQQAAELQTQLAQAQVEKVAAETELTMEKVRSEQVTQQVKMAGVDFDDRSMKVNEAKTVADIKDKEKQQLMPFKYDERGMSSNNQAV